MMPFTTPHELAVCGRDREAEAQQVTRILYQGAAQATAVEVVDLKLVVEIEPGQLRKPKPEIAASELVGESEIGARCCDTSRAHRHDGASDRSSPHQRARA